MQGHLEPVQFLGIGHITKDLTEEGYVLGGGVTYGGLTAHVLDLTVGIVSSHAGDLKIDALEDLQVHYKTAKRSTTFINQETPEGRIQHIKAIADDLAPHDVPEIWRMSEIVLFSPVANEINFEVLDLFEDSLLCLALQGWLREWDGEGRVSHRSWRVVENILPMADLVFLSMEDLNHDRGALIEIERLCKTLVVTNGFRNIQILNGGKRSEVAIEEVDPVDTTGAGDIFATSFIVHYYRHRDALNAAKFGSLLARDSVTRPFPESIPTLERIKTAEVRI